MTAQETAEMASNRTVPALDPANMDTTIKPTENFYQHANGGWLKNNTIPPAYSRWGSFMELNDRNLNTLYEIAENASASATAKKGSNDQLVGDFYFSGMDSASIDKAGIKPLESYFNEIEAIQDLRALEKVIANLQRKGVNILFYFTSQQDLKNSEMMIASIHQSGLSLPDRDYYTKTDRQSKDILIEYRGHIKKMFTMLGDNDSTAAKEASTIMEIESRLASASMTRVERRDPKATYNMMSLKQIGSFAHDFPWNAYIKYFDISGVRKLNVAQPKFIREVGVLLKKIPIAKWKVYLRWHLINSTASYLSRNFVDEHFRFYGTVLTGAKELQPRWKRVVQEIDGSIGFALGRLYVKEYFSPDAKARAEEMVHNLEAAFAERIQDLNWMRAETKTQALKKLKAIVNKIGYPDKWKSYRPLKIDRGAYVLNVMRANEFNFNFDLKKIGRKVDRTEWGMTPPTVNAYYEPSMNEIVFPAGILQPPFFNPTADDAVNYGGMGAVIGHEMTHGFDDQGSQFDAKGNLKNWWTGADAGNFKKKAEILVEQFDRYTVLDSLHVNGKLTEGENIADLGGVAIAYDALQTTLKGKPRPEEIDGFTPEQRFFLAWAQMWRENDRPEALRQRIIVDPHSPNEYRCNGPLSDFPPFHDAFGCKPGDPMYRAENVRAKIW
ncbi:MAG: M13 family metallopeptidase [Candidatus Kryptoniota bacterium]